MVFPLSGFTAVPNPVMLSFMGAQSFIMMYMAGEAWQFGKRKISAMTNEEFNKLTPLDLLKSQQSTLKEAIPSMNKSMEDMTPMFKTITSEMLKAIPPITKAIGDILPGVASEVGGQIGEQITGVTKEQYDTQAFEGWNQFWKAMAGAIPSLPGAEARIGPGIQQEAIDTIQIQNNKIKADAERLAAANKRIEEFKQQQTLPTGEVRKIPEVHQINTQEFKPKAGQTQIQTRLKLIKDIAAFGIQIKKVPNVGTHIGFRNSLIERMKILQTTLSGLIQRYRW